jgi:hypothetical protein
VYSQSERVLAYRCFSIFANARWKDYQEQLKEHQLPGAAGIALSAVSWYKKKAPGPGRGALS